MFQQGHYCCNMRGCFQVHAYTPAITHRHTHTHTHTHTEGNAHVHTQVWWQQHLSTWWGSTLRYTRPSGEAVHESVWRGKYWRGHELWNKKKEASECFSITSHSGNFCCAFVVDTNQIVNESLQWLNALVAIISHKRRHVIGGFPLQALALSWQTFPGVEAD